MASRILDQASEAQVDRRKVMRYALGAVAGAAALPVLAACGKAAPANSTTTSSTAPAKPKVPLLPTTGTPSWPVNVAKAQPTAAWSMYATQGKASALKLEMVTFGNDMWNANDNFSYYAQQHSGPGTWSCEVAYISPTDSWSKVGIMVRQSLHSGSNDLYFVTTVGNGASLQYRPQPGGAQGGPTVDPLAQYPIFLKMAYTPGKQVELWDSTDGKTWKNQTIVPLVALDPKTKKLPKNAPKGAIQDPAFKSPYYVGICACSHNPTLQGYTGVTSLTGFNLAKMSYHAVYQKTAKGNW